MPHDPLTVVIPTRNRRALLARSVKSVLRQHEVEVYVVVVDDASTDGSSESIVALRDPRIRVVRNRKQLGVSRARNIGLSNVESPWVAFLDDDDFWAPGKSKAQLHALLTTQGSAWCCAGAVHLDSHWRVIGGEETPRLRGDALRRAMLTRNCIPGGGSGVVASTLLAKQIGGFDPQLSMFADWDFYLRLSEHSALAVADGPHVAYCLHSGNMSHDMVRNRRDFAYMRIKHEDLRLANSVEFSVRDWLPYAVPLAIKSRQPRQAVSIIAEACREGLGPRMLRGPVRQTFTPLLRSVGATLLPDSTASWLRGRRASRNLPTGWLAEANEWLAEYGPPSLA